MKVRSLNFDKGVIDEYSEMNINIDFITYCGQKAKVSCDKKCNKAWGRNNRPVQQISKNEDDFYYLPDNELGEAPKNPGSYEGGDAKPISLNEFPNKWCVRECERCAMSSPGKWNLPLQLKNFSKPFYNLR